MSESLHKQTIAAKSKYKNAPSMTAFFKLKNHANWSELNNPAFSNDSTEYFVCHESNKEACLHWLNGGDVTGDVMIGPQT